MRRRQSLRPNARRQMIHELYRKYGEGTTWTQRLVYLRKRYSWALIVGSAKVLKRTVDVIASTLLLVTLSPLLLLIALLIKLTDEGPILFVTNRVGKWGKEFRFFKFRSMRVGADLMQAQMQVFNLQKDTKKFKIKGDPRVTWIGSFLRRTSLDELPQLWCILKGDMSLVGPRPPLPQEVSTYSLEERARLDTVPGLTGIWQVSGRSDIPFDRQVKLDVQYIQSQSFWLDVKILVKTIPAVILGRGAY